MDDFDERIQDDRANEMIVAGAVYAALSESRLPLRMELAEGNGTINLWLWLPFMKSRYRLTITLDPEPF